MLRYGLITLAGTLILCSNAFGQFGKNKVQYQTFEWHYITSPHFDIYFHDSLDYCATFCAYKAEEALSSIVSNFGFRPSKRLTIVIYGSHNQFQQTNIIPQLLPEGVGGVTELFKNRIVIPFEGDWEKFRHVIHHELVHAYLNEMFYAGSLQVAMYSRSYIPLWMNEGLAEYESMGGLDVQTDMFMRDLALSQALRPLEQLDGYLAYRGGQAFYAYIERQYGRGKIAELIHKLRNAQSPTNAFEATFGKSLEEFSDEWMEAMKKMYWPDLDRFSRLEDFAVRLTNHTKDDNYYFSSPAISPDGKQVALLSDRDGEFAIYIMDLTSRRMRKLISSGRTLDFEELNILTPGISWDPSGKMLAVTAKAGGEDALFIVDVATGRYERYTFGLHTMTNAAWSPTGRYIAVQAVRAEQSDLYLFDVETHRLMQLTDDLFSENNPTWSSDGLFVYFVSNRENYIDYGCCTKTNFTIWAYNLRASDIYRIDITTGTIERITYDPSNQKTSLAISSDDQRLLYVADNNGISNIYELNLATGRIIPRTNSLSAILQISLARDNSKLLFAAQNQVGYDIFLIRNPFEQPSKADTLPYTKLKQRYYEQQQLVRVLFSNDSLRISAPFAFQGYGRFDIEIVSPQSETPTQVAEYAFPKDSDRSQRGYDLTPRSYKVTITNDIIMGTAGYNSLWGSGQGTIQMLFSDLMGDHQIYAAVNFWQDLKNTFFYVQYAYLPHVIDYLVTVQQNSIVWALPRRLSYAYYLIRMFGSSADAVYAWNTFQRIEMGVRWVGITRENIDDATESFYTANYIIPNLRYVFDNTEFGFLAPYRGTRLFISAEVSPFTKYFTTFTTDIRHYIPVYKYLYGLMLRLSGGVSVGGAPRRFFIGGMENWFNRTLAINANIFEEPEDFAFLQLPMPLRGFELAQEGGTRFTLVNVEWRFPIFYALAGGPLPVSLGGILGALFLDAGTAWSAGQTIALRPPETVYDIYGDAYRIYSPGTILLSTGIGLRTVLIGYPFKIDVAWRYDGSSWSPPWWLFSLGLDL